MNRNLFIHFLRILTCLTLAGLAAMAVQKVHAQIFICQNGAVSEFDSVTGQSINPSLISGSNLDAFEIATGSDSFFVLNTDTQEIGKYGFDGSTINASFIAPGSGFFGTPSGGGLTVSTKGQVFLGNYGIDPTYGAVGDWREDTGAPINGELLTKLNYVMGLAVSGNNLFVAQATGDVYQPSQSTYSIGKYNAGTGSPLVPIFITDLGEPEDLFIAGVTIAGNDLYVTDMATGCVGKYNASTGQPINATFITGLSYPASVAVSGSTLFVASGEATVESFITKDISGGQSSSQIEYAGVIGAYNAVTGQTLNAQFITNLNFKIQPNCLAVLPQPVPGAYTALLSATEADPAIPQGAGCATMMISTKNAVAISGRLPDGEPFSASGAITTSTAAGEQFIIDKTLAYPSVATAGSKGSLSGTVTFTTISGSSTFSGVLEWTKPAQKKGSYPGAIATGLNIAGSFYVPPPKGGSVLPGFESGILQLSDTGGIVLSATLQLGANDKFALTTPPDHLHLAVTPSTGLLKGSFIYPGTRKSVSLYGVLVQDQISGSGFFVGPDGGGSISLNSAP
ncbi:MAG TPA: hypothetical protein VHY22_10940 [Chthoniobacteraceae bacterium]|jgi:hypothetical protein|nr:hypothetical protein [Chthoniobacteraceae bacterium]